MTKIDCDVLVIGGGPAGSTAAALLARAGHQVRLLEKTKFPREHVGESLLPYCYWLFEDLGVLHELKKRFVRKPGVRFVDGLGTTSTTWCFNHVIDNPSYLSFQVARAEFDHVLLKNAARLGADVREEVKVKDVDITSEADRVTVRSAGPDGVEQSHCARFLLDASGRDALIGSRYGWRRLREELDRTAVWSHWDGVTLAGGLEEGLSLILYMGQEQKGWIWVFPLATDRVTAGFVAQNSYIRQQRQKFIDAGSTEWEHDLCMQELTRSPFVAGLLKGARRRMQMMVNGNYSYEVKNHFGSNYAMIGDARGFIDPIFSSGVFLSMKSAYLVSEAVGHQLKDELKGANPLMVDSYEKITGAYNFVHRMIKLFYNPHALTWAEAGADGQSHKRAETAMAAGHYMLAGDFFENHEKYNKLFEILENPKLFRKYNDTVIERLDYKTPCNTKWEDVFGEIQEDQKAYAAVRGK